MDAIELIKIRRSIREYQDKPIAKAILEKIVDAARFAPTARGVEPWEFIVITKPETLEKLAGLADNGRFILQAKACIAVFCKDSKYYLEDGCAATQNILLAAASLGIGSCWVAGDKKPYCLSVGKLLGIGDTFKLVSLVSLGFPKTQNAFRLAEKRSLHQVLHWEKF